MARKLRRELLAVLSSQGFKFDRKRCALRTWGKSKRRIRAVHSHARQQRLIEERQFLQDWFPTVRKYLAGGDDVIPQAIKPRPVLVESNDEEMSALFRIASLWWSVPLSRGFGRRFRILVFDDSNGKLMGLLGLADPVFNLRTRDSWIGWDVRTRETRLAHVMDAYVLGSVPPYNRLLGAKLVAMLAASDYTRGVFHSRYRKRRSVILNRRLDARLALVTATSALGKSSVLNRLSFERAPLFEFVGFTQGFGHFHLANGTFEKIRQFLSASGHDVVKKYKFGSGPNYRIRVVRTALERLSLPSELLRHGIQRAVYVAPLALNTKAFLNGDASKLMWHHRPLDQIIDYWRNRWLLPRAARDNSHRDFRIQEWAGILGLDDRILQSAD
jgi:hypothetical protein